MLSDTDATAVLAILVPELPPLPDPNHAGLDAMILRRAVLHGRRAQPYFAGWTFDEAEAELRAGWLLNGESARWCDVRDAVHAGFGETTDRGET